MMYYISFRNVIDPLVLNFPYSLGVGIDFIYNRFDNIEQIVEMVGCRQINYDFSLVFKVKQKLNEIMKQLNIGSSFKSDRYTN